MSNVKKYIDDSWKVLASGQATGISVQNPKLLKNDEVVTSVDTTLERHENDIQKLYRNVAWLALNGGGGSGGSGGPEVSAATCTIKVNGVPTNSDSPVIMNTDGLLITFEDINVALQKNWTVTVRIGSVQIGLYTASYINNVIYIDYKKISERLINHAGNITVLASYSDEVNGLFGGATWQGLVIESIVNITAINDSYNIENIDTALFVYEYSVGIIGLYTLGLNIYKNGQFYDTKVEDITIVSNTRENKVINISDLLGITSESSELEVAGVYNILATLSYKENPLILGQCENTITIVTDNILVSTTVLSQDLNKPVEVSVSGTININYTAYLQGYLTFSYNYYIITGDKEYLIKEQGTGYFGEPVLDYVSVYNKEWALANNTAILRIKISAGDKSSDFDYYVKFIEASADFINPSESSKSHLISEFLSREYSTGLNSFSLQNSKYLNGGLYYNITSNITPINDNYLSVISTDINGTPYLRLSNGAFAKLEKWNFNNKSYTLSNLLDITKSFTLSICFKADYHPDDNRTILCFGSIDSNTGEISNGISIDVHDIYINNSSKVILTDNVVNIVDIVCYPVDTIDEKTGKLIRSYLIKIFLDGVLTAIEPVSTFLETGSCIYLGGKQYSTEEGTKNDYLCDCNIYNLQLFDTALSDLDILTNYINNKISHDYVNFLPNYSIINAELLKNFCELNTNNSIESKLFNGGLYTIDFLLENGQLSTENLNSYAKILGIPVMLIDVSQDSAWTFNNFVNQLTTSDKTLSDTGGKTILYWDPTENNSLVLSINNCTIGLQGTSTLLDAVKNINITVPNDTAFIPKSTWFPELTYTLKADIVDSSHSNNAAIGKFINTVLGTLDGAYFPFDETALTNVYQSEYVKNLHPTATLKHTVEGFPVLLIMKFNTQSVNDIVSVTPLGIYSFNLGRDAFRNLGFTKVTSIIDKEGNKPNISTFPCVFELATINETKSDANWIEINDTNSISDMVDKFNGSTLPEGFNSSEGDFWQNHETILNLKFSVRYGDKTLSSEYDNFETFVQNIMNLPIEGTYSTYGVPIGSANIQIPLITGPAYDLYKINNGKYTTTGSKLSFITDVNAIPTNLGFNEESAYKYFTIALLFGLIDNFGKNSTYRSWKGEQYFVDFYDLDSALGGGNQGYLDIAPDVWIKFLKNQSDGSTNDFGYISETYKEDEALSGSVVSANHSKLWLSLDTELIRARRGINKNFSIYSEYWFNLRNYLLSVSEKAGYNDFVEYFINEYYIKLTGNCGSLLFNYDYKLKYLLQFTGDDFVSSKDLTKLHGRKISYSREWLKKHIIFLDSLFYWRNNSGELQASFKNNLNNKVNGTVYVTPKKFVIKTNSPIILKHSIGNATNTSYFIPENKEIWVNAGNNSSPSALAWSITNSSNIINLGNDDINLSALNLSNISMSSNNQAWDVRGLPSITELNLKNNEFRGTGFTLDAFELGILSELRVLDFSGTSGTTFSLSLNKYTPSGGVITKYSKLTKIDISDSTCITELDIPNIPLKELFVRNSAISKFILRYLKYLNNVDLTGCNKLTEIEIDSCDSYTLFSINNLTNITKVSILNCPNITNISINNCPNLKSVNIENCSKVSSISILKCKSLIGNTSDNYITIAGCTKLTKLQLNNNENLQQVNVANSNLGKITTLNISYTKITSMKKDNSNTGLLDLSDFSALTSFNISNNSAVSEIQFSNNESKPIILSNRFYGCSNLTRIYGHIKLSYSGNSGAGYGMFRSCKKFSIHGTSTTSWKGITIKDGTRIRTPWEMLTGSKNSDDYKNITLSDLFLEGKKVTNVCFGNVSDVLTYTFNATDITLFDIYYLLCTFALSNVTNTNRIYYAFASGKTMFSWSLNCHPDRNMFYKCSNITAIYYGFNFSGTTLLPSPEEGKDNGLFSPLINLTILYDFDVSGSVVFSRKLFHRVSGKYSKFTNISFMSIVNVFDDDNDFLTYTDYTNRDISKLGNFTDFFKDLPAITNLYALGTIEYLNLDTLKFPVSMKSIISAFNATYATGTLDLEVLFPENSACTELCESFIISNSSSTYGSKATMPIQNTTLKNLRNIKHIGYRYTEPNSYTGTANNTSFRGNGLLKYIVGDFPTEIVKNCPELITFGGFFREVENKAFSTLSRIPGDMFKKNTKLQAVGGLMYNALFPFLLSGEGFSNCPNLSDVSYMCYFSIGAKPKRSPLTGEIPYRLFYHGKADQPTTITYKGSNNTNKPEIPEDPSTLDSITVTYDNYNKNIKDISYCFYGCTGLEYYRNSAGAEYVENNSNYTPFKWLYNETTKVWTEGTDFYEKDASWGYTGDPTEKNDEYKYLENEIISKVATNTFHAEVLNYMCAPDLLRYCTNSNDVNINGLFSNCGLSYNVDAGGSVSTGEDICSTGITGRIVPYLLLPVSNITSIQEIFRYCRRISSYQIEDITYLIPHNFFNYANKISNLRKAFLGLSILRNTLLNVFNSLKNPLDIRCIFANGIYEDKDTTYSNIFINNTISYISGAFSYYDLGIDNSADLQVTISPTTSKTNAVNSHIRFSDNFNVNKIPNSDNIGYVYYGWGSYASDTAIPNKNYNYGNN